MSMREVWRWGLRSGAWAAGVVEADGDIIERGRRLMAASDREFERGVGARRARIALLSAAIAGGLAAVFYTVLALMNLPADSFIVRYTMGHWIEQVEVAFFLWGMAELLLRTLSFQRERAALHHGVLRTAQRAVPASEAPVLLDNLAAAPRKLRATYLARRLWRALVDVRDRQGSEHLDDYLKDLAERDADESHGSFALARVIAWAIPILGFLGTVVGITIAIANITPTQLEESLPEVTGGLAVAFDTTALALSLSMVLIFTMLVVEKLEQRILASVDVAVRHTLGHRFLASSPETTPYLAMVKGMSDQVIGHTRDLVNRQSELWSQSLVVLLERLEQSVQRRDAALVQSVQQRDAALVQAIGGLAEQWRHDTSMLETSHRKMESLESRLERLGELMVQRVGEERGLVAAQDRLAENLRMLRQTQSFDEALHSLTAAVHLLTMRSHSLVGDDSQRTGREPKAA